MNETPQGVKISAYLFFAQAALTFLGVCALIGVAGLIVADTGGDESLIGIVFAVCIVFVFVLLYAGVGYGLLQLKSWSRIAAIVLAIISLCSFPIGTILGGIVLYLLFQPENAEAFS